MNAFFSAATAIKCFGFRRVLSSLLIAALLLPVTFSLSIKKAKANQGSAGNISNALVKSNAAPPEPFTFTKPERSYVSSLASFPLLNNSTGQNLLLSASEKYEKWRQLSDEIGTINAVSQIASVYSEKTSVTVGSWLPQSVSEFFGFSTPAASVPLLPPSPPSGVTNFDYDGDGKADASRYKPDSFEWRVRSSQNGTVTNTVHGSISVVIVPANYDGDTKTDYATFNASTGAWSIKQSSTGAVVTHTLGQTGDKPVAADYDGDGKADPAVFRASNGTWYYLQSGNNYASASFQFGQAGDVPVVGNYDGDSRADFAVFRSGEWLIWKSSTGSLMGGQWGAATDVPAPADFDGDGKTDYAVFRKETGTWYALKSSATDGSFLYKTWGNYGDQPVSADYNGDGRADYAVWRPTTGVWYIAENLVALENYSYYQLGAMGDVATPAAYLKQSGFQVTPSLLARERLSPKNATGGTNLYSRNFSWGTGLVGLPGRSGMDMGLSLSYNSLVWTKEGNNIYFDADASNVTPGFRFGFPTIEPAYLHSQITPQVFAYLMVSPSGARTELRQLSGTASDTYEAADSSYLQLKVKAPDESPNTPPEALTLTLLSTDGTRMDFAWNAGAYRCTKVTDRNGNYITVNHDEFGYLRSVTDTLGRVVTIEYYGETEPDAFLPKAIKQTWQSGVHTWATFTYSSQTVNPNFNTNLTVYGPTNNTSLRMLQKVSFADGGYYTFDYNRYGQVYRVNNYAADNHRLNYMAAKLAVNFATNPVNDTFDTTTVQTDCPRFSETRTWAENFNVVGGAAQPVTTKNRYLENQTFNGIPGLTLVEVESPEFLAGNPQVPTKVYERSFMMPSGWHEALTFYSETCTSQTCPDHDRKRWVWTTWTQDDNNLSYLLNPRVTSSTVSDLTSSRKTEIDYHLQAPNSTVALFGLVKDVKLYDVYQNNRLLKTSSTSYNLSSVYTSRRIIGLPSEQKLFDDFGNLVSKVTFTYDEGDFTGTEQNITPVQHDNTSYGASFIAGRGNLTSTTRWSTSPDNTPTSITSSVKYNTAGAVVAQITPGSEVGTTRTASISYADKFVNAQYELEPNRNTYAYPTKVTDPAGYFSTVNYRFDIGANVRAESPAPHGGTANPNSRGKVTLRTFDSIGRLERETVDTINGADPYTRYIYYPSQNMMETRSTVTDFNGNDAADVDDEASSIVYSDGLGRTRAMRSEHPGSTGGYTGQLTEYDILGRIKRQSVPTEINSAFLPEDWQPAGDDFTRGWLWSSQEYDWKGRVTREINTDGTDKVVSYDGCGCAGGEVVTVKGELIVQPAANGQPAQNLGRRTQKIFSDILGRQYKTQIMNWDEVTPYSTVVNSFNGRDQVINSKHYQGVDTAGAVFQETTFAYDGHGRLQAKHLPEQDPNTNTTYEYYLDDQIKKITDARGATVNYEYNSRGLTERIFYTAPASPSIQIPGQTTFQYDAAGNRTLMTDQTGSKTYNYNELSQLKSETKQFNGQNQSPTNSFTLSYEYQFGGELKSMTDAYGRRTDYSHDKIGRLTQVATSPAPIPQTGINTPILLNNVKYRAWGGAKSIDYGTGATMTQTFNDRLQVSLHRVRALGYSMFDVIYRDYSYYADGRIRYINSNTDTNASSKVWDKGYKYDNLGRITTALTSAEARGEPPISGLDLPYRQSYTFDVWGNRTSEQSTHWSKAINQTHTYSDNRESGSQYDADGRITSTSERGYNSNSQLQFVYDAAGQITTSTEDKILIVQLGEHNRFYTSTWRWVDGDGQLVGHRATTTKYGLAPHQTVTEIDQVFSIRSSVLQGSVVNEFSNTHFNKNRSFVFAFGNVLAIYIYDSINGFHTFAGIEHRDPSNTSYATTQKNHHNLTTTDYTFLDPLGRDVGSREQYEPGGQGDIWDDDYTWSYPGLGSGGAFSCRVDGAHMGCRFAFRYIDAGMGVYDPGPRRETLENGLTVWAQFRAHADGTVGYNVPVWTQVSNRIGNHVTTWKPELAGWRFVKVGSASTSISALWGVTRQQTQQDVVPLPDLEKGVKSLLENKECADFIKSLINQLAERTKNPFISDHLPDLFKDIEVEFKEQKTASGLRVAGMAHPRNESGIGKVGITPQSSKNLTEYGLKATIYDYVHTYIDEIIHLSGKNRRYTNEEVASASVNPRELKKGQPAYKLPEGAIDVYKKIDPSDNVGYSGFNSRLLQYFCPGPRRRPTFK